MARAGLTRERVAEAAAAVSDDQGFEHLTVAAVAQRLGVSGPAIYKHVASLDALQRDVAVAAVRQLTAELAAAAAGLAGADALRALGSAYRAFGRRHPGQLTASVRAPAPGDDEHVAAGEAALAVLAAALRGYELRDDELIDALRVTRSALHGFTALELAGGFGLPRDLDATFERHLDTLDAGLRSWRPGGER